MNILVVGSGGREHALVWKLKQSPKVSKIYCAPGNAGIASLAACIDIGANDIAKLADFATENSIDLTVVGPEDPLTEGIVDYFQERSLRAFGPSKGGAILEASKVFTKDLLHKYNIPTGYYKSFTDRDLAVAYIEEKGAPLVVKADGLAAGKGVIVAQTVEQAIEAVDLIMLDNAFGEAGRLVVVEEFLEGEEASFLAFTDGKTVLPLPTSQDHKAVFDGDKGPNTGGMGAYSPAPVVTPDVHRQAMEKVMIPTVKAMAAEGRPYKGLLYAGLMIKDGVVKVLEFNVRFGDPECQPLMMRLESDLVEIMEAVIDERLHEVDLKIDKRPTVCVVMASGGYPGSYEKGKVINGLGQADREDVVVFHAGTTGKGGEIVTAGGRVLGITARGTTLAETISMAYGVVAQINWDGCYFRNDIGQKAMLMDDNSQQTAKVGIILGSKSDLPFIQGGLEFFKRMEIPYELTVASAHRTPERAARFASTARQRGLKMIIAGAGMAAHLAGVLAAHTTLPVIGVPFNSSDLNGLDSLLATVQMPPGVPVATMGIGAAGAKNAAILAAQILAVSDEKMAQKLREFKLEMAAKVDESAREVAETFLPAL